MKIFTSYTGAILTIAFLVSCNTDLPLENEDDSFYDQLQAIGELELIQNEQMHAILGQLVVTNLEHLNTPMDSLEDDSYLSGIDVIPYYFPRAATHIFTLDTSGYFSLKLVNPTTDQVLVELTPENNEVQLEIDKGFYELHLTSQLQFQNDSLASQPVFINSRYDEDVINRDGIQTSGDPDDYNWLVSTNYCFGCDLSYFDFSGWNLTGVTIMYSNLAHANLSNADLTGANIEFTIFEFADLSNANFSIAIMGYNFFGFANLANANFLATYLYLADMTGVYAPDASFIGSSLRHAELNSANLNGSIFGGANLYLADFSYSDLTNADFSNAQAHGTIFCYADTTGWTTTDLQTDSTTQCGP